MPNKANARKAMRQTEKRTQRNKIANAEIKSLRIKLRKALTEKQVKEATELTRLLGQKLDKAMGKQIIKKNTAARYKSRMMKKLNALGK